MSKWINEMRWQRLLVLLEITVMNTHFFIFDSLCNFLLSKFPKMTIKDSKVYICRKLSNNNLSKYPFLAIQKIIWIFIFAWSYSIKSFPIDFWCKYQKKKAINLKEPVNLWKNCHHFDSDFNLVNWINLWNCHVYHNEYHKLIEWNKLFYEWFLDWRIKFERFRFVYFRTKFFLIPMEWRSNFFRPKELISSVFFFFFF